MSKATALVEESVEAIEEIATKSKLTPKQKLIIAGVGLTVGVVSTLVVLRIRKAKAAADAEV